MERKHSFSTKALALFLAVILVAALTPAFVSLAEVPEYEEEPGILTFEQGNLARGEDVELISQYDSHYDLNWGWQNTNICDGKMNTVESEEGTSTGGFHTNTTALNGWNQKIFDVNHEEWVGYNFGKPVAFDTVVVYPSMDSDGRCVGMPNAFAIEVSVDGENYKTVYETYCYDIPEFGPQTVQFEEVTAQYVRFKALSVNKDSKGKFAMKLSELAVYKKGYKNTTPYCPNLALNKPVLTTGYHVSVPTWTLENINDGDRYNLVKTPYNWGQFAGWHTTPNTADDAWIQIDLEEKTAFDKVVIWPSTERYWIGASPEGVWTDNMFLPDVMKIEISENAENWTEIASREKADMPTTWGPIEITFNKTEARYVRLYMTRSDAVKLSEFEIFDTSKTVTPEKPGEEKVRVETGVNFALTSKVIYSSVISDASWGPDFLKNGETEISGGFTTAAGTAGSTHFCGYEFSQLTRVNKIVLYSADNLLEPTWSGIPRSFKVQYSVDELNWIDVTTRTYEEPVSSDTALTILFDEVDAKYIRIWTNDPWEKTSDGNRTYIQLAEMEVSYEPFVLTSEDAFSAFYQVKEGAGSSHDLRVLLVANLAKLPDAAAVTVKIEFTLASGGTKTVTGKLGGENSDYTLYKKATAGGDTYTATEGCAIFGNVITGIPEGAYTNVKVTITNGSAELLNVSLK